MATYLLSAELPKDACGDAARDVSLLDHVDRRLRHS